MLWNPEAQKLLKDNQDLESIVVPTRKVVGPSFYLKRIDKLDYNTVNILTVDLDGNKWYVGDVL